MKIQAALLVLVLFIAGCNDFRHARYGNLDKVPANGNPAVFTGNKAHRPASAVCPPKDSLQVIPAEDPGHACAEKKILNSRPGPAVKKAAVILKPVLRQPDQLQEKIPAKTKPISEGLKTVLQIALVILVILAQLVGGILLLSFGFSTGAIWMMALGAFLLLALLLFFLGIFSSAHGGPGRSYIKRAF